MITMLLKCKGGSPFSECDLRYCKVRSLSMLSISCCSRSHVFTSFSWLKKFQRMLVVGNKITVRGIGKAFIENLLKYCKKNKTLQKSAKGFSSNCEIKNVNIYWSVNHFSNIRSWSYTEMFYSLTKFLKGRLYLD